MTNEAIRLHIKSGDELPTGSVPVEDTYNELIRDCSAFDAVARPSFLEVIRRMKALLKID
eukprot:m.216187 g.216187  ORF g.216187 m.216187 type:complete len:60 (+) comp39854_c0_seq2:1851-2030(+)